MWHVLIAATSNGGTATGGGAIAAFLGWAVVRALYNATPRRRAKIAQERAQRAAWNTYRQNKKAWEAEQKRLRRGS